MKRKFFIALIMTVLSSAGGSAMAASSLGHSGWYENAFYTMDASDNNLVSKSEFNNYIKNFNIYKKWDANNDSKISKDEFYVYTHDPSLFKKWDTDNNGWIGENELCNGLFNYYDSNHDGHISNTEWRAGSVNHLGDEIFKTF